MKEENKRLIDKKAGFKKLDSKQKHETETLKQKFEVYKKNVSNENILLKNEKELVNSKVENMKTSSRELNLTAGNAREKI